MRSKRLPSAPARRASQRPGPLADNSAAPAVRQRRHRLAPEVRERMILEAAVAFFAEHGFEAQTKDLANQVGVSQGLIFRYFGTKQNLIERVYEHVFVQRLSPRWEAGLRDRGKSLQTRLEDFYLSYFDTVDESQWIRVSLYAGLAGHDIIARYIQNHLNRLLVVILEELRIYFGLKPASKMDPLQFELVWHLHSTFIYFLIRKYIHRLDVMNDKPKMVARIVKNFLAEFQKEQSASKLRK
jgi:AcrR family transcriptional regulator